jgi:endonuclease/exonuclease/phosphatase family metal-dependent hydrolase
MLLQEVAHFTGDRPSIAATLAKEMNYHVMSAPSIANADIDGLAIISRYPLTDFELMQLQHNNMVFHTRKRIAIAATVHTPFGPLRVYNVHLDSRINSRARLTQIAPVISKAEQWNGPRLIGGDLNTNYLRWAGNVIPIGVSFQGRAIQGAMSGHGFSTALDGSRPTSDFLRLRLDWIYTRDLQVSETSIQSIAFSDHHAVQMTLAPQGASRARSGS